MRQQEVKSAAFSRVCKQCTSWLTKNNLEGGYRDYFTELTAELQMKIDAELIARKKQYEYYRDKLLTFKELQKSRSEVPARGRSCHAPDGSQSAPTKATTGYICACADSTVLRKSVVKENPTF